MRKLLLSGIALAALGLSVPACAADMAARPYTKAPPPAVMAPIYNWTGFYIGGHVGADWFNQGGNNVRFIAGAQGGADYEFVPNWVAGVEANYSFKMINNGGGTNRGVGSATGRLGYSFGPALLYAKGGYAFRDAGTIGGRSGYTVGGGLEYMFAQNWSTKLEYQYFNFSSSVLRAENTFKVGLNYRFNVGSRY